MTAETLTTPRTVRAFVSLDEAERDRVERDEIVLMDLHGLWWSVPMELDIHAVNGQIITYLAGLELGRFPNLIVRMARRDHPVADLRLARVNGARYCRDHGVVDVHGDEVCDHATTAAPCDFTSLLYVGRRP